MKINIHAGHGATGQGTVGAIGLINESDEARKVCNLTVAMLEDQGHTVYNCTQDTGTANEILKKIVNASNAHDVDLNVSIHFNAGGGKGTEVYVYSQGSKAYPYAEKIVSAISALGFNNRGVKIRPSLYVLRKTKAPALLVECCFVDTDDALKYNAEAMAKAIVAGITGQQPTQSNTTSTVEASQDNGYIVKVTGSGLRIRKGAGTNYEIVGTLRKGTKYTIVETQSNWGKLKSGAGWICLDYTERC